MTAPLSLTGGTIVTPTETLTDGVLTIVGDSIETVGAPSRPPSTGRSVDVSGRYVLPGFVDIHGDDIERYLSPRPEEQIPVREALRQSERAALAAGITTKFHAVAYEDTPDQGRSVDGAQRLTEAILDRQGEAVIDARVHARCEVSDEASVAAVTDRLRDGGGDLVSLMHHVPGDGQYDSTEELGKRYEVVSHKAVGQETAGQETAGQEMAGQETAGQEAAGQDVAGQETVGQEMAGQGTAGANTDGALEELVKSRGTVPQAVLDRRRAAVVSAARAAGVPVASHDDEDAMAVDTAAAHGVDICEFPLSMDAARRATEREMTVAMGAPNLVRGGSLWENLSADAAVEADAVDVFCSDFRPQTLLGAAFAETGEPLYERVARVTSAPARAVGLTDRGRLQPGARADVVVVDPAPTPTVSRVFVAGDEVYRFDVS